MSAYRAGSPSSSTPVKSPSVSESFWWDWTVPSAWSNPKSRSAANFVHEGQVLELDSSTVVSLFGEDRSQDQLDLKGA